MIQTAITNFGKMLSRKSSQQLVVVMPEEKWLEQLKLEQITQLRLHQLKILQLMLPQLKILQLGIQQLQINVNPREKLVNEEDLVTPLGCDEESTIRFYKVEVAPIQSKKVLDGPELKLEMMFSNIAVLRDVLAHYNIANNYIIHWMLNKSSNNIIMLLLQKLEIVYCIIKWQICK